MIYVETVELLTCTVEFLPVLQVTYVGTVELLPVLQVTDVETMKFQPVLQVMYVGS